jgi:hypothetical protein
MIRKGDEIECIDNEFWVNELTVGKVYVALSDELFGCVEIENDLYEVYPKFSSRFKPYIKEVPDEA